MGIRKATVQDAEGISVLLAQLGYPVSQRDAEEKIKTHGQQGYSLLVAEDDSQLRGFIALHWYLAVHLPGPVARITAFCVDREYRGKGIGTELLRHVEEMALAQGCFKIEVTSNRRRIETHRYYAQHQYQQTSEHFVKFLKSS